MSSLIYWGGDGGTKWLARLRVSQPGSSSSSWHHWVLVYLVVRANKTVTTP
jgi:hypothetical protein